MKQIVSAKNGSRGSQEYFPEEDSPSIDDR